MQHNDHEEPAQPIELFPRKYGKTAFLLNAKAKMPETITVPLSEWLERIRAKEIEGYIVFEISTRPVVVAFALAADGNVILVRQYRHAANQEMTEVPGGLADGDEPPEETARRELWEETGFAAGSVVRLTDRPVWFDPASVKTPFWPCLAQDCRLDTAWKPAADERLEVLQFPLSEWVELIRRGEILDAKSIVATFLALPRLENHKRPVRA